MNLEQIFCFAFATCMLYVGYVLAQKSERLLASMAFTFVLFLVALGGIDPNTLTNLTVASDGTGHQFSLARHQPSEEETETVLEIAADIQNMDQAENALFASAELRAESEKSATDYLLLSRDAWEGYYADLGIQYAILGLNLDPKDYRVRASLENALGACYNQIGAKALAIKYIRKSTQTNPDDELARYNLGVILEQQGRLEEAVQAYEDSTKIEPGYVYAHTNLGLALRKLGKLDEAEKALKVAVDIESGNVYALHGLGLVMMDKNDLAEAERYFRLAITADPDNPEPYYDLGQLAYQRKDWTQAESYYRKAIFADPNFKPAFNRLSKLLEEGKISAAITQQ